MQSKEMFGPFRILEKIGSGDLSEVFLAEDTGQGDQLVAIKRMLPDYVTPELIRLFQTNHYASSIQHPNVIRILGFGTIDETPYLVMELVRGMTIKQIQQKVTKMNGVLPVSFSLYVIREAALALDVLNCTEESTQKLPTVKRNMTPQNVMVTNDGEVKIFGWSIAKMEGLDEVTQPNIIKGVFGYMSPEQIRAEPVDQTSDLFSLGIVFWELLTGQRLFVSESPVGHFQLLENFNIVDPSELNAQVPPFVADLALSALARNRKSRPQSIQKWASELSMALDIIAPNYSKIDAVGILSQVNQ